MTMDEPAINGAPSSFILLTIHVASSQLWLRCLSENTGTASPDSVKTPQICSIKYLRGKICCCFLFQG